MTDDTIIEYECPNCEDTFEDEERMIRSPDGELYCGECFDELYSFCDWCEEYESAEYFTTAHNSRGREIYICGPCTNSGDFSCCEACGDTFIHDYMHCLDSGCYCDGCADEEDDSESSSHRDWVRGYHDNPTFQFIRDDGTSDDYMDKGTYYLGLEIELESSVRVLKDSGFVTETGIFRNLWACHDGSLSPSGVELITMPGTLEAWRKGYVIPWAEWYDKVHTVIPDQSQHYSNGIHVHVSRQAFARPIFNGHRGFKESAAHLFKFLMFIERNESVMHHIGGRSQRSSFAKFNAKDAKANRKRIVKKEAYADRYNIVNVGNRHTIELRFFDGRSDTEFIKRAVELTHAMVEYTRGASTKSSSMDFAAFMDWVLQRRAIYPALWAYVMGNTPLLKKIADQSQFDYEALTYDTESKPLDVQDRFHRMRELARERANTRMTVEYVSSVTVEYVSPEGDYTDDVSPDCSCAFCVTVYA